MKIFLDDLRPMPDNTWEKECRDHKEFMAMVFANLQKIKWVSFDHDLGDIEDKGQSGLKEVTGYTLMRWFIETCVINGKELPILTIHSANNIGCEQMEKLLYEYQARGLLNPKQQDSMFKCFYLNEMEQIMRSSSNTYRCMQESYHNSEGRSWHVNVFDNEEDANEIYNAYQAEDRSGYPTGAYSHYSAPFSIQSTEAIKNHSRFKLETFKDKFNGWREHLTQPR